MYVRNSRSLALSGRQKDVSARLIRPTLAEIDVAEVAKLVQEWNFDFEVEMWSFESNLVHLGYACIMLYTYTVYNTVHNMI